MSRQPLLRVGDRVELCFYRFGDGPLYPFPREGIGSARDPVFEYLPARIMSAVGQDFAAVAELENPPEGTRYNRHALWRDEEDRTWRRVAAAPDKRSNGA